MRPVGYRPSDRTNSGYLKFISYMQIIGIILVVFGHSFHESGDGNYGMSLLVYRMMHSFRMPMFLFVSGYLMLYTSWLRVGKSAPSVIQFTRSKVRRLLIPFLTLSLVTFVPRAMMSGIADDTLDFSWQAVGRSLLCGSHLVIPYFWFLQASFILLALNFSAIALSRRFHVPRAVHHSLMCAIFLLMGVSGIMGGCEIFSIGRVFEYGIFFVLGVAYADFAPSIDKYMRWESPWLLIAFSGMWGYLFFRTEGTPCIYICSLFGILMCISLTKILEARHITILDHLRGANYMIFLLSWYFNVLCQQVLHHYTDWPWPVYTVLSLVAGVYVPWQIFRIMQRGLPHPFWKAFAFLLGQKS